MDRKYDKCLKLAKEALNSGSYNRETIEYIFPELGESEDERIIKALIRLVISIKELHFGIDNYDGVKWDNIFAWLEKQKEQKSAEWSGRDEEMIELLVSIVEWSNSFNASMVTNDVMNRCVDWLKSLRPQKQWKPTKEQMEALENSTAYCEEKYYNTLDSLYNDLKQL